MIPVVNRTRLMDETVVCGRDGVVHQRVDESLGIEAERVQLETE